MPHGFELGGPITRLLGYGTQSMGNVTKRTSVARFGLKVPYTLMFVRALFTGGSGSATMTMKLDRLGDELDLYDFTEDTWLTLGVGGSAISTVRMVVPADEWPIYTYPADHELVFEWANPNSGTMRWALEVGLRGA